MYDERAIGLKNFKLDKDTFLPRLGYLATGDKFTTNCVSYDDASDIAEICADAAYGRDDIDHYVPFADGVWRCLFRRRNTI
jgi:hypothetical protein